MRISELADGDGREHRDAQVLPARRPAPPRPRREARRAPTTTTSHLERVRLVRTLIDVGRLSIDRVREVVTALDQPPESRHQLLGTAHDVLRQAGGVTARRDVTARLAALGLPDCVDSPASTQLAQALSAAEEAGWPLTDDTLPSWYAAMTRVADADVVPELAAMSPGDALRHAIVGNVLTDPVVIALRRVAQEALSAQRFDPERVGPDGGPHCRSDRGHVRCPCRGGPAGSSRDAGSSRRSTREGRSQPPTTRGWPWPSRGVRSPSGCCRRRAGRAAPATS